jgi:tRNA(Ser,Leu) C12 N-acetylase TAN1
MSRTIEDLVESIDGRIRELNGEIASLQDARSALTNRSAPARVRTPRRAIRAKRVIRRKPGPKRKVLLGGVLERMLADSDGLTTAAIAKQGNADRDQVLTLLKELETAGRVRRTGERRATRWYAYTDEDRIQKRAAELASRSRRPERP